MSVRHRIARRDLLWRTMLLSGSGIVAAGCAPESLHAYLGRRVPDDATVAVSVGRGPKPLLCTGFGFADRAADIAADGDTVFDIGSVTKQFTAAAVLRLEADRELTVTDPLSRFVDDLPRAKRGITLHHLLTHTAGLVDVLGPDDAPLSRERMWQRLAESRLLGSPGSRYRYSNLGYSALAAVIEQVSGVGYERYLADRLLAPAGLSETGYLLPGWRPERIAMQYDRSGRPRGRPHDLRWDEDGPYWNLRGNGGILSTARDMGRWAAALRSDAVLPVGALEKLFEPYVREEPGGDTRYGYGWVVQRDSEGNRFAWHNGGNSWSYSEFAISLDAPLWAFWATNQVRRRDRWNLEELDLASDLLRRAGAQR